MDSEELIWLNLSTFGRIYQWTHLDLCFSLWKNLINNSISLAFMFVYLFIYSFLILDAVLVICFNLGIVTLHIKYLICCTYFSLTANIILRKLNLVYLRSGTTQRCSLLPFLFNIVLAIPDKWEQQKIE